MTAAYRLKGLGWFGGCVVVTLGFYLVSLQVAAERKRLERVDAKILSAERDIRALETEFDTRANLAQLERWNGDTLSLVAPTAQQFVRSESELASIRFDGFGAGGGGGAQVQTAALLVPSMPTPAFATPVVIAAVVQGTPVSVARTTMQPRVDLVRHDIVRTAATSVAQARPATAPVTQIVRKAQAVAMLDRTLLSDSTFGDLMRGARAETGRLR